MRFGFTIIYVADVAATVEFYERAFGLNRRLIHPSGYAEMETGETALAFASHELGAANLPDGYSKAAPSHLPFGIEIAFVTDDVNAAFERAVSAGALGTSQPRTKPWGQIVAYVRDMNGILVELCSPMG